MTIKDPSLSVHGYQLLLIVTSQLVGDSREFDALGIFWGFLLIVGGWRLIAIQDPSVSAISYQLLNLATSQLLGDNSEFDIFRHIFTCLTDHWWRGAYKHWISITECPWLPIVAPSNQSVNGW